MVAVLVGWPQPSIIAEVSIMKLLKHRHVLPLYAAFVEEDQLWMVMPFVSGGSALDIMQRHHSNVHPPPPPQPTHPSLPHSRTRTCTCKHARTQGVLAFLSLWSRFGDQPTQPNSWGSCHELGRSL